MGFGASSSKRREAARKHSLREHRCSRCGRVIKGNAYYRHKYACQSLLHPSKCDGTFTGGAET